MKGLQEQFVCQQHSLPLQNMLHLILAVAERLDYGIGADLTYQYQRVANMEGR